MLACLTSVPTTSCLERLACTIGIAKTSLLMIKVGELNLLNTEAGRNRIH